MARRHAQQEEAQIDMTPMLDVTFILLIFFIVTTSFVKPTGVEVNKPMAMTTEALAQGNILVGINADDEIYMHEDKLSLADVRIQVEQALASTPKSSVVLVIDRAASTSRLIAVMDKARMAGAEKVWIATKEAE